MALIWQKDTADSRYEVRTHGASVRLYSNGVFHSQWNPRDPLKGSLWELLLLPAFFLRREQIRSVLVLGVGGGAVIRLLQRFVAPARIVGVDIDPVHLEVARCHFGVHGAELICADAREYLARQRSSDEKPFDLIIDDLFGHTDGVARRGVTADEVWCSVLLSHLSEEGVVVGNFGSRPELLASGWRSPSLRDGLRGAWTAELAEYENCLGVFSRHPLRRALLAERAPHALNPRNPQRKLRATLRPLR